MNNTTRSFLPEARNCQNIYFCKHLWTAAYCFSCWIELHYCYMQDENKDNKNVTKKNEAKNYSKRNLKAHSQFGQLIECNMRNIFLEKSSKNVMEKLVPETFLKNQNWTYLWINSLKCYTVCFYCMASWGLWKYIEIKLQTTCFHLILSFFKK